MKKEMKPLEIMQHVQELEKISSMEDKLFSEKAEALLPPKIAIAIAKNRKSLCDELSILQEIQTKNEKIAKEKDIPLAELDEQKKLLENESEIEIVEISEDDLAECNNITSVMYLYLGFMIK